MLGLGDTVILPKPGHETEHLWALVTAVDPQNGEAVMVNLTTRRPHSDTTTVLQPGDHPFVDRPTVAFYADALLPAGTYRPISEYAGRSLALGGSGAFTAVGGTWDGTSRTFTVAPATALA